MYFEADKTYHIYNRSNELVFHNQDNYYYFLNKVKAIIPMYGDVLAWCLMPNHFHFLMLVNDIGSSLVKEVHRPNVQMLSKGIGSLLSGYTRAVNKRSNRRGRLFAHQTSAKCLNDAITNDGYLSNCIHYIHSNPKRAGLCEYNSDWDYSSYKDYCGDRNGRIVNRERAYDMMGVSKHEFKVHSLLFNEDMKMEGLY